MVATQPLDIHDEKQLRQLEEELHIEILPGTEIMADFGSHHFVKQTGSKGPVLVPQPSNNPHDPLNWTRKRKALVIFIANIFSFALGFGPLALPPQFGAYIQDFDTDLPGVIQFIGVCILILGFSNFLWVPISTNFGRRPVLIWSTLVCLASSIWHAEAKTYGSFMGACILNGIGAGPAETMQPVIIADVLFLHERGFHMTLYMVSYFGSLMIGPIVAGAMTEHQNWQSFWWLNVALFAAMLILIIFCFPETKYTARGEYENTAANAEANEAATENDNSKKTANVGQLDADLDHTKSLQQTGTEAEVLAMDPWLHKGYPSKHQWRTFYYPRMTKGSFASALIRDLWVPWKLFAFPIVQFAAFVFSWSASNFLVLNLTQTQVFAAPPYNFSPQSVGFTNFAVFAGALFGLFTSGPFSDWIAMRQTIRNNGIREPEMRLLALIPYTLLLFLGSLIAALGYQYQWPWPVIIIIGYSFIGCQVTAIPSIVKPWAPQANGKAMTYAIDSYKPIAGEFLVSATINKNLWGYGVSKFITAWIEKDGFIAPIMTNNGLTLLWVIGGGVGLYFFGKHVRRWTKNSYVHRMEEHSQ